MDAGKENLRSCGGTGKAVEEVKESIVRVKRFATVGDIIKSMK